jgi:HSP20 family protein
MAQDTERMEKSGRASRRAERVGSGREIESRRERGGLSAMRQTPGLFALRPHELLAASPFELMRRLSDEMNRAFEGFGLAGNGGGAHGIFSPSIEVTERDRALDVCVDLPGIDPEDVRVELTEDGLLIQGERRRETEDEAQGWYRSERSYGRFARVIPLPPGADAQGASARFENGVLRISVPLSEAERRRAIPIESSGRGDREARDREPRDREQREREPRGGGPRKDPSSSAQS